MLADKIHANFRPTDLRRLFDHVVLLSAIAIIYVALAKLSLALASIHPSATPIWPPTGYALATVLLLGYRVSPAVFLGAFIANITTAGSIGTSFAIASGNVLESLVGAYLINQWSDGRSTFDTPAGVARFALICLLSTVISPTFGVGSLSLAGYADWSEFPSIWTTWWMGDLSGALVITPAIVLWGTRSSGQIERRELLQSCAVYTATVVVGLLAFSPLLEQSPTQSPLAFLAILPLMWAALRRNQRDTATTALLLSCFAVWGTKSNHGPFVGGSLNESFLLLLTFMISVSVPSLALSADLAVRQRHDEHIHFVMRELSHRSKNILSVVQSMATQVARQTDSFDDFVLGFSRRLCAFAETHDLLVMAEWQGVEIRELIRVHLAPFRNLSDNSVLIEGPQLKLSSKAAEQIGLALHELGTNAVKYGALSVPTGMVKIRWDLETDETHNSLLRLIWKEVGGPPVEEPQRQGFGDIVLTKVVPVSLRGTASLEFEPEGIKWVLLAPSSGVLA
jgi:two-component sensor histidine kinase